MVSSFFYQRVISVARIRPARTTGASGYRAPQQGLEEQIFSSLPVNIRMAGPGERPLADVPADVTGRTMWKFVFPFGAVPPGSIRKDDIATDDLGRRFKLMTPDWKSVGAIQAEAELLVA